MYRPQIIRRSAPRFSYLRGARARRSRAGAVASGAIFVALVGCASAPRAPAPPPPLAVGPADTEVLWVAPPEAALVIAPPALVAEMDARLVGHRRRAGDHVLVIEDIAGRGRPWIGVVVARCDQLWLATAMGAHRLVGSLARARVAGPGYLVWVLAARAGDDMDALRLGVLLRPDQVARAGLAVPASASFCDR